MIQMIMANQSVRLNHTDHLGENAIFYAAKMGEIEAVKELIKRGCHLQRSKFTGKHPAHMAWK